MRSKLEIYALAACFASVICLVIASGVASYSIFKIALPKITMSSYIYGELQTNDAYWLSIQRYYSQEEKIQRPSENELTNKRLRALSVAVEGEQREGIQSLINSLIFVIIGGLSLLIHWKIGKAAREQ